jgi:Domain of Unknown Function (DUF1080)
MCHRVLLRGFAIIAVAVLPAVAARAADDLPPPELTEVWTPVPVVVSAPAGGVPSDAVVLFDGRSLDAWEPVRTGEPPWRIVRGVMTVVPNPKPCDMRSKQSFGDVQLHLEFRTPSAVSGEGQSRGNSGIYFMGLYELQILDSWRNPTYANGQAASIYKQIAPLVNASRAPGRWQTYDAVFIAPRFSADGRLLRPARMTAFHNGVLVQHDVELRGPTVFRGEPKYSPHAARLPLVLQDHRNRVGFRNIWVRELTLPEPPG